MPRSSPNHDDQPRTLRGTGIQNTSSFRVGIQWSKLTPQTWLSARVNRSCEKGIRISAVHPVESTAAFAVHTGSKELSRLCSSSLAWYQSARTPEAVMTNVYAVRRSRYVSSE